MFRTLTAILCFFHLIPSYADDSPQHVASRDFAFCVVFYMATSLSAPESDKALGEKSLSAALKKKALSYANVGIALTNEVEFKTNIEEAKKYFGSLKGGDATTGASLQLMKNNCSSIEARHSEALATVTKQMQGKDGATR